MQGERRAETRSSYAEPQPSLAVASQMQWQSYDIAEPHCLTVTDLAKLFLKKLQKCGFLPTGGYHNTHTARCYLALGGAPRPLFPRASSRLFHQPQPLLHKKGLQTTPQTPRQSLARGLIDSESWLSPSKFWYDSQSLRPSGVSHGGDDYASRWSFFHVVRVRHGGMATTLNAGRLGGGSRCGF